MRGGYILEWPMVTNKPYPGKLGQVFGCDLHYGNGVIKPEVLEILKQERASDFCVTIRGGYKDVEAEHVCKATFVNEIDALAFKLKWL